MTIPLLEGLVRQTEGCLASLLDQYPERKVETMFLCGGQSKHPQLQSELQQALGIPTISLNPFAEIDCVMNHQDQETLKDAAHLGGVALGLALHRDNHGRH